MTKFLNISTDNTLGGNSPSDDVVSSQKAIKTALNAKANSADLATVATSGSYNDLSNKPSIPTVGNGTITITQGGVSKGTFTTNQSGNTTIALDAGGGSGGSGLNIGDIFMTMRTDNELNGAVECDGATYNTTDFTGTESIGTLLEAGKLDYISLSAYSTAISTKGWCDKIGWDGTGNTQFRVPTLNAHIVQTNNIPVIGNGISVGLTNGTDNANMNTGGNDYIFAAIKEGYGQQVSTAWQAGNPINGKLGITTDPTKSGIIADTTDTAQLRVMIQLATGATDTALETCTSVLADVATLKGYDYVVEFQAPTAQNNYTWYRKYKSGWVEQGGRATTSSISFPITMADTNYQVLMTQTGGASAYAAEPINHSTTGFTYWQYQSVYSAYWQVSGIAA